MTNDLLKVLDMSGEEQWKWLISNRRKYGYRLFQDCLSGNSKRMALADLAFRLHQGKIAGKKPIEYIIEALIKLDNATE